jgi:outer membrane murein-binding lipoprotein Lpp
MPVLILALSSKVNELIDKVAALEEKLNAPKKRASKVAGSDTKTK